MTYEKLLETMPPGLDRALLSVLSKRVGMKNAIKKRELMVLLRQLGFKADERQIREAIRGLRKQRHLIGSTNQDGYFLLAGPDEWRFVKNSEFLSRVGDIMDTVTIMDKSAREQWGDGYQEAMF
jgi:hypothetical protein